MRCNNLYKIGLSKDPEARLKTFQTGNTKIQLLCYSAPVSFAYKLEHRLHEILKLKHKQGEWFSLTDEDVKLVEKILTNLIDDSALLVMLELV